MDFRRNIARAAAAVASIELLGYLNSRNVDMADVFLHYATPRGVVLNQSLTEVNDLTELRAYAVQTVQSLITAPSLEDWRNWVLHVRDDLDSELFVVPFLSLLGKPH